MSHFERFDAWKKAIGKTHESGQSNCHKASAPAALRADDWGLGIAAVGVYGAVNKAADLGLRRIVYVSLGDIGFVSPSLCSDHRRRHPDIRRSNQGKVTIRKSEATSAELRFSPFQFEDLAPSQTEILTNRIDGGYVTLDLSSFTNADKQTIMTRYPIGRLQTKGDKDLLKYVSRMSDYLTNRVFFH
jgi:hypothetical protein